jgi:MarR family 2-MHQ and catechol resistance regulon transcriptional repressor
VKLAAGALTFIVYNDSLNSKIMPTHFNGTAEERLALDTLIKLVRAANAISSRLMGPLQRQHGVTESQLGVIEALYHLGPLTQGQLGRRLLKSGSNLTTVVDNLERGGLVRRERDASDRRVQNVHLTAEGRALVERILPAHVAHVVQAFAALSAEEQRELGRLCRIVGTAANP